MICQQVESVLQLHFSLSINFTSIQALFAVFNFFISCLLHRCLNFDLKLFFILVSVYELTPHEKLILLTTLMDELLLQPQIRERMEDNYERVRLLRNQLRTIQADRTVLINCGTGIEEEQDVLTHMKKMNSTNDGRVHFAPVGLKGRLGRGRGRPVGSGRTLSRKNTQLDSTVAPLEKFLSE